MAFQGLLGLIKGLGALGLRASCEHPEPLSAASPLVLRFRVLSGLRDHVGFGLGLGMLGFGEFSERDMQYSPHNIPKPSPLNP